MAGKGSVNKVILIGNLGADPEVRYMPNGNAVANISIATTDSWKDKQTGERQERTEWHRVVLFNKLGEIAGQYLRKGSKVYVEGNLRTRKWQDQNGQDRYSTEVVARDMTMLDSKGAGGTGDFNQGFGQARPAPAAQGAQTTAPSSPSPTGGAAPGPAPAPLPPDEGFDDDIPF